MQIILWNSASRIPTGNKNKIPLTKKNHTTFSQHKGTIQKAAQMLLL